jgi:threonine dehydratase
MPDAINLGDLYAARQRIAGIVRRTPLVPAEALSPLAGTAVHYKLETLQATGAFKTRGAANKILSLPEEVRARGVTTVSTGNHGRAVAYVARAAGCRAVVCLSELVPENKKAAIRAVGGEVKVHGRSQDEAAEIAFALERDEGMTLINPFDDPAIVAGQGTAGLEIVEDLPRVDTVLVPVSGGGLIGGVAMAIKAANPWARVIGVSMDRGAAMYESQKAGKPILVEEVESLADSLGGGIFLDNKWTFRLVRGLVDDLILVTEEEIARAMAFLLDREHFVVEGGGAVGVAAILAGKVKNLGENCAVLLSGTNVDSKRLRRIAAEQADWLDTLG